MRPNSLISLLVLILAPVLISAQDGVMKTDQSHPMVISARVFHGFERCEISKELSEVMDILIAHWNPLKKKEGAWVYTIDSQIMGLPVKAIEIGVCDDSGERACGWGSYVAIVIAKPLEETKDYLKNKTGDDFKKEERDEQTEVSLRPILVAGDTSNDCIIFCDPGSL